MSAVTIGNNASLSHVEAIAESDHAEAAAAATLHDVREAMRINYFDDEALMNQPYEKQH